jgi:RNA polymerase sigma-70 factor (ECF subfamily)
MLGSVHDPEDLVQETFLRAWRGIARFEGRVSFRAWLYRIATNACLNAIASRRTRRRSQRLPGGHQSAVLPASDAQRTLLARYVRTWETADIDGFVALLREDAAFSMPPWSQWYVGRDAIAKLFAWIFRPGGHGPFRLVPVGANGPPGFAFYSRFQGQEWRPHSIQLLTLRDDSIAAMTSFVTPSSFPAFGLPAVLPD